jgi:outer membrane protein assembly factor BamB
VTHGTTICCRSIALVLALAAPPRTQEPLSIVPIRFVWTLPLNSHITLPPTYDETHAYFTIEENRLVAYELAAGKQIWLVEAKPAFQPVSDGRLVFINEADAIVARRVSDGTVAWRTPLAEPLGCRPSVGSQTVIGITKSGTAVALRAADGTIAWQQPIGTGPHAPAAIAGDRLYAGVQGLVVARRLDTGELIWERRVGGSPGEILALDDRIYLGSTDNFFYCLLTKDGQIDWRWRTGADVTNAAVADAKRVYFVSLDNVLRALDRVTGGQQWMKALPLRPTAGPRLSGPLVIVAGQSSTIRTYAVKDGTAGPEIPLSEDVVAPLLITAPPGGGPPQLVLVTRHIVRGDTAALAVRSLDPPVVPLAPLPNAIMPAPRPVPPP